MYRLKRINRKEARIFGVCGGLAKYIDPEMDPIIMRIIWVALSLFQPFFIILYFILALVLKQEEAKEK
jgi:phage shock protein C